MSFRPGATMTRRSPSWSTLRSQLAELNHWQEDDPRIDEVVRRLRLIPASLEGNEQFSRAARQWNAYDPARRREYAVALIDYANPKANVYHFSEEIWFQDRDCRRPDNVLYVNGLPVVLVENKSPKLQDPGLEGFNDVQDVYTRQIPSSSSTPSLCRLRHAARIRRT